MSDNDMPAYLDGQSKGEIGFAVLYWGRWSDGIGADYTYRFPHDVMTHEEAKNRVLLWIEFTRPGFKYEVFRYAVWENVRV